MALKCLKKIMEDKFDQLEIVLDCASNKVDVKRKNTSKEADSQLKEASECWRFWWEWSHGMASPS